MGHTAVGGGTGVLVGARVGTATVAAAATVVIGGVNVATGARVGSV